MRFTEEQEWSASAEDVLAVYLSADFWTGLKNLSATSSPEVLDITKNSTTAVVRLHYVLAVDLPKEASRFIDPNDVAWVEETTWSLPAMTAQVRFLADQASGLLKASASADLAQHGPSALRSIRGEVKVHIPLLGGRVEKVIVQGVQDHLREEAVAVQDHLA
ncbi:MAG: DUF2505 domain-containing protein [Microthrixaceae bacterium]